MCAILDKEKKKAVLSCIRNGRVVYIGEGQVIVAFKTAFMVKRANREDYFKFTDAALSQILGGTYHMQGFLEGDAELSGYEKRVNCPRKGRRKSSSTNRRYSSSCAGSGSQRARR